MEAKHQVFASLHKERGVFPNLSFRIGRAQTRMVSYLNAQPGRPFLVDTGEAAVDALLCGYARVITGYNETAVYLVTK